MKGTDEEFLFPKTSRQTIATGAVSSKQKRYISGVSYFHFSAHCVARNLARRSSYTRLGPSGRGALVSASANVLSQRVSFSLFHIFLLISAFSFLFFLSLPEGILRCDCGQANCDHRTPDALSEYPQMPMRNPNHNSTSPHATSSR